MLLTVPSYLLWGATTLLELILFILAVRRRLYLRLPFFTGYLALVLGRDTLLWWAYHTLGSGSRSVWYIAYITQGVMLLARGAAVAEVCCSSLRAYRGIWALTWRLLFGVALLLLLYAGLDAYGHAPWISSFLLVIERGLELAAAALLLSLLIISVYYGVRLGPVHKMVAVGLCFYSGIQVLNNTFMRQWLVQYFHWWNGIRVSSFLVALLIWLLALRKPLPARAPAPVLLPQNVYDELSPQVNYRVRVLNERLLELLKS